MFEQYRKISPNQTNPNESDESELIQPFWIERAPFAPVAKRTQGPQIARNTFASFDDRFNMVDLQNCPLSGGSATDHAREVVPNENLISQLGGHPFSLFSGFASPLLPLKDPFAGLHKVLGAESLGFTVAVALLGRDIGFPEHKANARRS